MTKAAVTRIDFIRKFMQSGLTYDQACCVYSTMMSIFESSILSGQKIKFGKFGCLLPVRKVARSVTMGFVLGPGNTVTRTKRIFHINKRTRYHFRIYREYARRLASADVFKP